MMRMIITFLYYGYNRHCKLQQNQHEDQVGVLGWYKKENSQLPDMLCPGLVQHVSAVVPTANTQRQRDE